MEQSNIYQLLLVPSKNITGQRTALVCNCIWQAIKIESKNLSSTVFEQLPWNIQDICSSDPLEETVRPEFLDTAGIFKNYLILKLPAHWKSSKKRDL